MALSTILKEECPHCGKIAVEASRSQIFKTTIVTLACGHIVSFASSEIDDESIYEKVMSRDGHKLRQYQIEAVRFAERSNFNCIIADEQGLGKTIQISTIIRLHYEKILPMIIAVPSTVSLQWMLELIRWCEENDSEQQKRRFLTQVIKNGKDRALPGFQIYIISYDMLKNAEMFKYIPEIKCIVIDECQRIKNHLSDRAKAIQTIVKDKNIQHVIPMSGTPIKNHAGEYFTVLNLVDRRRFPQYQRFIDTYCDAYNNGWSLKIGGLKDPARFHEDTKDIIIRRTKAEVLKELPMLDRKFYHVELDRKLNKAYAQALEELDELMYSDEGNSFAAGSAKIAIMSKLRHITGLSKVTECIAFATEFLESTDRKLTVFVHHQDVAETLYRALKVECEAREIDIPLNLTSSLSGDARQNLVINFKEGNARILIASTLAAGEGLNLQFCSDAVMLERQWNPANEEQAEGRFHRFGQKNNVSVTYMLASGTIDEYFTELVEVKRGIVASTLDNKEIAWDQNSLMKELCEMLVTRGRERWRL